jgi:hypothetical protein
MATVALNGEPPPDGMTMPTYNDDGNGGGGGGGDGMSVSRTTYGLESRCHGQMSQTLG